MSRAWRVVVGALLGLVLVLVGYIGGRSRLGALLVPNAAAQTTPSTITLAKPSCVAMSSNGFACVADLDGNGKQEIITGMNVGTGQTEWIVQIVDGTGVARGTGTKLVNTP
jgi:hypothetical protein